MKKQTNTLSGWTGWILLASFWLGMVAVFQMIAGLTAILQEGAFVITENRLILLDYQQWGWAHLILGVILLPSAFSLASGKLWGRFVGIVAATLSLIANFAFMQAYPWWSLLIIVLDLLIIYSIVMHGSELREA
jgi:hypothetical protein